jgi:protein-disulfide isomerase
MKSNARWASPLVAVFAVYLAACTDPQAVSEIKGKVDEIQAQQKDILAKLDAIDKGQKEMATKVAAPARPPGPPPEDPNKVYNVPVGNSFSKGPANAKVTLVEFSDFQ